MKRILTRVIGAAFGVCVLAGTAAAQAAPETPDWSAPAASGGEAAGRATTGKAAKGKPVRQRSVQGESTGPVTGGSMRKIDRNEIDMSGTGTEREGPSSFRPMLRNGGVGLNTAF